MSRPNAGVIELGESRTLKAALNVWGQKGGSGYVFCVCVFSSFFSRIVCDSNEGSVHRLSQAALSDFKVM